MQILRTWLLVGLNCLGLVTAMSAQSVGEAFWRCRAQPVGACFTHHGRLSSHNGIALKIWLIGTMRVVGVANDEGEMPSLVAKYLDMTSPEHSYVYGDFNICPLAPDEPGHMRLVCVSGAEKLVVQNLRGSRPPFRLLSTWPAGIDRKGNRSPD
jgi:hypothetical protein